MYIQIQSYVIELSVFVVIIVYECVEVTQIKKEIQSK